MTSLGVIVTVNQEIASNRGYKFSKLQVKLKQMPIFSLKRNLMCYYFK